MCIYRIVLSYAVYGIEVHAGKVVDAAPMGEWMVGKNIEYIKRWVRRKGGTMEKVDEYAGLLACIR